jgi:hypothetical protein
MGRFVSLRETTEFIGRDLRQLELLITLLLHNQNGKYDREHLACAKLNEHGLELFRQKYKIWAISGLVLLSVSSSQNFAFPLGQGGILIQIAVTLLFLLGFGEWFKVAALHPPRCACCNRSLRLKSDSSAPFLLNNSLEFPNSIKRLSNSESSRDVRMRMGNVG